MLLKPAYPSQERGHEKRQMKDAVLLHDVLRVEDVGASETSLELLAELVEGGVLLVFPALHLDGTDFAVPPDEKVNLRLASVGRGGSPRIEEQRTVVYLSPEVRQFAFLGD